MSDVVIRSPRHRAAVEAYNRAYARHQARCGHPHGFRASIPIISKAQNELKAAEREIEAAVAEVEGR